MRLTTEQKANFNRDGYVSPLFAVSPWQSYEFRRRIESFEQRTSREAEGALKIKGHLAAPWMVDLACHPAILDAVEDLIGPDILLLRSSLFAKNAHDSRFVSWHQDSIYYGLSPNDAVTAWVAFTDSNPRNGCLRVMPGSHLGGNLNHEEHIEPNNLLARGQTIPRMDESRAVDIVLKAGEFSIHHERTAHSSRPNTSSDRRIGLAFFYAATYVQSVSGRRDALLVRGTDVYCNWNPETLPQFDLDPACMGELDRVWAKFQKAQYRAGALT